MMSRILSLLVAVTYLVVGLVLGRPRTAKEVLAFVFIAVILMFPLGCIWFADEIGNYTGALPGPAVNRKTPGFMISIAGWFLLLLPAVLYFFRTL